MIEIYAINHCSPTYNKSVYLGKDELVENWREATEEEKKAMKECKRREEEYEKTLSSGKVE